MKNFIFILIYFVSASPVLGANDEDLPCWISGDSSQVVTSQVAILKTYLLPINLDDPKGDAEKRIKHGDYRLIGIGGLGLWYPSLDKDTDTDTDTDNNILCKFGWRYIQGTSDFHESDGHTRLISKFVKYAELYNETIIDYYNNQE